MNLPDLFKAVSKAKRLNTEFQKAYRQTPARNKEKGNYSNSFIKTLGKV